MERKADPLRTCVARWLACTELRIEVQESTSPDLRNGADSLPPLDDKRLASDWVGIVAVARLLARGGKPAPPPMATRPAPAGRGAAPDHGFPDDLFPDHCRGVSIPEEFLQGLVTPS